MADYKPSDGYEQGFDHAVDGYDLYELAEKETPVAGTIYHEAKSIYDLGAIGMDLAYGDPASMYDHATDLAMNQFESLPGVGTALGFYNFFGDKKQHEENMGHNLFGAKPNDVKYLDGKEADEKLHPEMYNTVGYDGGNAGKSALMAGMNAAKHKKHKHHKKHKK